MKLWKQIKRSVQNYLERLGKQNQELFGGGIPDCCKLNREQAVKK